MKKKICTNIASKGQTLLNIDRKFIKNLSRLTLHKLNTLLSKVGFHLYLFHAWQIFTYNILIQGTLNKFLRKLFSL